MPFGEDSDVRVDACSGTQRAYALPHSCFHFGGLDRVGQCVDESLSRARGERVLIDSRVHLHLDQPFAQPHATDATLRIQGLERSRNPLFIQ